jgi:hypothetical protein
MLPTFVCIGAQKTGTSWLYSQLLQHPQVFLPTVKELNFFHRELPQSWYARHFDRAASEQARGDISPNYMVLPGVAGRMHALLPAARLICIVREPVARAKSQYPMAVKLGNLPADMPFMEAFRRNLQYLQERGCYLELLQRFTHHYSRGDSLQVFLYDDLVADAGSFFRRICAHIGVDADFKPTGLTQRVAAGGAGLQLSDAEEAELRSFYAPHIDALERYLGRSLQAWRQTP